LYILFLTILQKKWQYAIPAYAIPHQALVEIQNIIHTKYSVKHIHLSANDFEYFYIDKYLNLPLLNLGLFQLLITG